MTASQTKVIECATGDFGVQANLFASMLVEAYQAANVAVQVSDMRGAVEKHNDDGSVVPRRGTREGVQLAGRRPGAGLSASGEHGTRRRNLQDQPIGSGHLVTALLDADAAAATADDDVPRLASWQARAGAIALDVLPGVAVITTMFLLALHHRSRWLAVVGLHGRTGRGGVGDVRQSMAVATHNGLDHGPRGHRNSV